MDNPRYATTISRYRDFVTDTDVKSRVIEYLFKFFHHLKQSDYTHEIIHKMKFWRTSGATADLIDDGEDDALLRHFNLSQKFDTASNEFKVMERLARAEFYEVYLERVGGDDANNWEKNKVKVRPDVTMRDAEDQKAMVREQGGSGAFARGWTKWLRYSKRYWLLRKTLGAGFLFAFPGSIGEIQ